MSKEKDLVAGLDIGTVKTCCVVAQVEGGKLEIVGVGKEESSGVRKGVIVNIDATVESINSAIAEAENMSGVEINSVYVGIAGSHLMDMNSHGVIAVNGNEVEHQDIDRVIEAAQAVNIPLDREILHVVSQEFIVDNQDGILKPLGMNGVRLESKV
ncbi:MAG: cell division protein FtsA, partial [Nitrospinota bacterium]